MASYPVCPLPASQTCITYLTRGQSIGLTVATTVGFVSAVAVIWLFSIVIRNTLRARRNASGTGKFRFFRSPLDVYMCSLLVSDLLQGVGKILHVKWLHDGIVQCGGYCTAQGVIQQLGETGVAQGTLVIAVQTFIMIFFRRGSKAIVASYVVVALIWAYVILFTVIGATTLTKGDDRYITPVPYWCWISAKHQPLQISGEYFWMWLAAFVSLVLYFPLYLCLFGYVEVEKDRWWRVRILKNDLQNKPRERPRPVKQAILMLLYPVSYVILVLPDSICRWMEFRNQTIPSAATFFSTSIFGLSGLVNVILLMYTRSGLLLLDEPPTRPAPVQVWFAEESPRMNEDLGLRLRPVNSLRSPDGV